MSTPTILIMAGGTGLCAVDRERRFKKQRLPQLFQRIDAFNRTRRRDGQQKGQDQGQRAAHDISLVFNLVFIYRYISRFILSTFHKRLTRKNVAQRSLPAALPLAGPCDMFHTSLNGGPDAGGADV